MGSALLSRWQQTRAGGIREYVVIDPNPSLPNGKQGSILYGRDLSSLPEGFMPGIVVFALKPQELAAVLPAYKTRFGTNPLYLSIAAGKTISFFSHLIGSEAEIIRAMPNTPALVGEGMTVMCASSTVQFQEKDMATQLMEAVGRIAWVEDESLMDAVTALSGSGPAYTFVFLDALTKAGIRAGLAPHMAKTLAVQTVAGSCALVAQSASGFEVLRKNVTSPGGTTEAALAQLMLDGQLEKRVEEAIQAAVARSRELGGANN